MSRKFTRINRKSKLRKTRKYIQKGGNSQVELKQGSKLFKDVYVISTDKYSDRYKNVEEKAKVAGVSIKYWPATVLEKSEKLRYELPLKGIGRSLFSERTNKMFNLGSIGCYLSHRNLLEYISKIDDKSTGTLILEDDAEISPDFFKKLSEIELHIPNDWDMLFLDKWGEIKSEIPIYKNLVKIKKTFDTRSNWGTYSYIVKNSSIKSKILPVLERMVDYLDVQYNIYADKLNEYIAYGIIPYNKKHNDNSIIYKNEIQNDKIKLDIKKPWALIQYDNRPIPDHYKKLIEVNKEYCKHHGYHHIFKSEPYDLPHWWIKVKICKELLESDKYSGVMWLDTDAVIYDCSINLDTFTNDKIIDFFIAKDPPAWGGPINAGVWIVKNTEIGKNIMRDWFSHYDKTKWIKNNNIQKSSDKPDAQKWINEKLSLAWYINPKLSEHEQKWAGINFEQGALYEKTIQNSEFKNNIKILPNIVLSNWVADKSKGTFTLQFFSSLPIITKHTTEHYIDIFFKERLTC
jgi:GR25 family glycosyltransferase involved in LPS biosynthesis